MNVETLMERIKSSIKITSKKKKSWGVEVMIRTDWEPLVWGSRVTWGLFYTFSTQPWPCGFVCGNS